MGRKCHIKYSAEDRPFACEICPYRSKRKAHLKRHIQEKHGPNERIQCEYCNGVYKNERNFAQHACFYTKPKDREDPEKKSEKEKPTTVVSPLKYLEKIHKKF